MLASVALAEAQNHIECCAEDGAEDVNKVEFLGAEIWLEPRVIDNVADQEE